MSEEEPELVRRYRDIMGTLLPKIQARLAQRFGEDVAKAVASVYKKVVDEEIEEIYEDIDFGVIDDPDRYLSKSVRLSLEDPFDPELVFYDYLVDALLDLIKKEVMQVYEQEKEKLGLKD